MKSLSTLVILFIVAVLVIRTHGKDVTDDELNFGINESTTPVIKSTSTSINVENSPAITVPTSKADDATTVPSPTTNSTVDTTPPVTNASEPTTNTTLAPTTNLTTTVLPVTTTESPTTSVTNSTILTTTTLTTLPVTNATSPVTTTTRSTDSTTTVAPGRKFDGLSFLGGIILAVGIGALAFLVARYVRRSSRMPYANLQ